MNTADAELTTRIAGVVREAVQTSGYSIKALAEGSGISRTTLIRKLRGTAESPFTPAEVARLAPYIFPRRAVSDGGAQAQGEAA